MTTFQRDPSFWAWVAEDEDVARYSLHGVSVDDLVDLIANPEVLPFRFDGGGFVFRRLDPFGFVLELHSLFRREAWGRSVVHAARTTFPIMFNDGAQVIVTSEQFGWWRSAPPRSHGWKLACETYRSTQLGGLRTWVLTPMQWASAPAIVRKS